MHSVSINGQHVARPWRNGDVDDPLSSKGAGSSKGDRELDCPNAGRWNMHRVLWGHGRGCSEERGIWKVFLGGGEERDGKAKGGRREEGTGILLRGGSRGEEPRGKSCMVLVDNSEFPVEAEAGKIPDRATELRGWRSSKPWKPGLSSWTLREDNGESPAAVKL